ncbi:hypothetical protein P7K49_035567 [Saguinus oedipus]|uniref:Uncharacterized protein n=1 Tax=Saguinus oedipus TaxID=9490 RepID=A0ABQ9TMX7_SAGOE|nr:hypothetical protein P7K49_035567 [Saguinus oedipus]
MHFLSAVTSQDLAPVTNAVSHDCRRSEKTTLRFTGFILRELLTLPQRSQRSSQAIGASPAVLGATTKAAHPKRKWTCHQYNWNLATAQAKDCGPRQGKQDHPVGKNRSSQQKDKLRRKRRLQLLDSDLCSVIE